MPIEVRRAPTASPWGTYEDSREMPGASELNAKITSQASVSRDVLPPTPPGPEGSNGNGLLRVQ
jgi:hypothetical protein